MKFIILFFLTLIINLSNQAIAQNKTLTLHNIRNEVIQNARDFNQIRQANMESGINFQVASDLGELYSQTAAEIQTCIVANYLFEVGDKKYQSTNKDYMGLIKKECLMNMDFAINKTLFIQGNAKNPNTISYAEKLRDHVRRLKQVIEAFPY